MTVAFAKLPFDEAIQFLKEKGNLQSEHWADLWQGMHSRGFVVSGATKNELLVDIHNAINAAIENGGTLNEFKKNFRQIVADHGWTGSAKSPITDKESAGWRAATIFNTNMRTAYSAGQYKQMTEPAVLKARPYWRYIGGLSRRPRPLHLQWSGLVLPANDPWWHSHYPPNGWGCKCKVVSLSEREMKRDGLQKSKQPDDGERDWKNPNTGEIIKVPNGIDPGWDYNPGQTAWGESLALRAMRDFKGEKKGFTSLTEGNWESDRLSEKTPVSDTEVRPNYKIQGDQQGMETALRELLGGPEKVFSFESRGWRYDFNVNAKSLAESLSDTPDRAPFLTYVPVIAEDPSEIWQSFEQNNRTKQVVLRYRFIKSVPVDSGDKGMVMVMDSAGGQLEALTFFPVRESKMDKELNKRRRGKLVWPEKD